MHNILTYNAISSKGTSRFCKDQYSVGPDAADPIAIMLRSQKLHDEPIADSVLAIARAGAGVNNVPVDQCSERGIVVFNTPGANANAVKELVISGMLLASRDIIGGINFVRGKTDMTDDAEMAKLLEKEKKNFAGTELHGKTLGVIGLGAIGVLVANVATYMGMEVIGFDPAISVESAWRLSRRVQKKDSIEALIQEADFVTVHVPAIEATHHMINADNLKLCKDGTVLLNFAREQVVDSAAAVAALDSGKLRRYVTDFPTAELAARDDVIPMPHIGASTGEAEENCAVMAADQLMDFVENGNIKNSVNFPLASLPRSGDCRLTFSNKNVPKVLGSVLSILAESNNNVADMLNKSRGELAYNIIDVETPVTDDVLSAINAVEGVISSRVV